MKHNTLPTIGICFLLVLMVASAGAFVHQDYARAEAPTKEEELQGEKARIQRELEYSRNELEEQQYIKDILTLDLEDITDSVEELKRDISKMRRRIEVIDRKLGYKGTPKNPAPTSTVINLTPGDSSR